jgi:hypothetical protein
MKKERTLAAGYRRELPYKRKLVLITEEGNPKNEEIKGTVKAIWEDLLEETEFQEIDFNKHPKVIQKYDLKTLKTYTRPNPEKKEGESVVDYLKRNAPVEGETLALPVLVFLEDDVVEWQHQGIVKDYTLWAAMTRKPIYQQPGDNVVPVNYFI